ncbi:hypothetical protein SRABI04_02046 [Chryseobacterium sp. Bi04]|nr:hypothetical protein SRABI04_02046 [Chryseobacterium sp. Bi04]
MREVLSGLKTNTLAVAGLERSQKAPKKSYQN